MFGPTLFDLGIWQWIVYGVQALAVVMCLGVIARAVLLPSDVRRRCCCGACGHPIVDTATDRCPECGGQLTKVGISTPAMAVRLRGGLGWALLAWTVVCGFLVQVSADYIQQSAWAQVAMTGPISGGSKMQHSLQYDFVPNTFSPDDGFRRGETDDSLKWRIESSIDYIEDAGALESGTAEMTLRQSGTLNKADLSLELEERTFKLTDSEGALIKEGAAAELTDDDLSAWFVAAGLATSGKGMETSLRDVRLLIQACFDDPEGIDSLFGGFGGMEEYGSLRSQGGGSSSGPVGGFGFGGPGSPDIWTMRTIVIAGVLGLVYLAGCVLIWWRHRRLLV